MPSRPAPFIVRDARADERDAVRELTLRAYGEYATVMAPASWAGLDGAVRSALAFDGPVDRIVAVRDESLLGSVHLFPPATDAYGHLAARAPWPELRLLAVAPEGRGQGVGRALVEECARRARASGAAALGLHTSESMRVAMSLYERMGFERAPDADFQPPGAELVRGYRLRLG
ncbi:GCN5-related N-acetyltransferase [Gemmatirosa kalamazoonensis]|uniref:GCN5-related N-acetyltransferase n=1 Tax=Gemmatirosa kalamazoonensis TaxID=861299 RepID=W0RGY5_9BACT|nr:GNAT family N-acetyltransferase [Gemmatirosa kalamazoonensis]AHG88663.1 GCN5-related N-acetyltransferase [Gemmatirosa kalamazoonensis]